jgi:hypothetical protein
MLPVARGRIVAKRLIPFLLILFLAETALAEKRYRLEFSHELLITDNILMSNIDERPVDDVFVRFKESISWRFHKRRFQASPYLLFTHHRYD